MSDHRSLSGAGLPRGRWLVAALAALLLVGSLGVTALGLLGGVEATTQDELRSALEAPAPFDVPGAAAVADATLPAQDYPPNTLAAPGVSLTVPLEYTGLTELGDLAIPIPEHAGIFTGSAPLAADAGSTLIAGHVTDPQGAFAPMAQLALLKAGDLVVTVDADGTRRDWTVIASTVIPRIGLPQDLWQSTGERKLILVTCASPAQANTGVVNFTDNLVVTAVPR